MSEQCCCFPMGETQYYHGFSMDVQNNWIFLWIFMDIQNDSDFPENPKYSWIFHGYPKIIL